MMLPKRIDPCPIIESGIEIRFSNNINSNMIIGMVYNSIKYDYKEIEELPILQVPIQIRKMDNNLRYQPFYKLVSNIFNLQIGDNVLILNHLSIDNTYIGWDIYFEEIKKIVDIIKDISINSIKIIDSIERVGVRYIDFFENIDIFDKIKFEIKDSLNYESEQRQVRNIYIKDNHKAIVNIMNNTKLKYIDKPLGSIIDIDVSINNNIDNILEIINKLHLFQKEIFFNIINEEYLKSLNPSY